MFGGRVNNFVCLFSIIFYQLSKCQRFTHIAINLEILVFWFTLSEMWVAIFFFFIFSVIFLCLKKTLVCVYEFGFVICFGRCIVVSHVCQIFTRQPKSWYVYALLKCTWSLSFWPSYVRDSLMISVVYFLVRKVASMKINVFIVYLIIWCCSNTSIGKTDTNATEFKFT